MDSLSRLVVTSSGKGSRLASLSSSPFRRSRCRLDGLDLAPSAGACFTLERTGDLISYFGDSIFGGLILHVKGIYNIIHYKYNKSPTQSFSKMSVMIN